MSQGHGPQLDGAAVVDALVKVKDGRIVDGVDIVAGQLLACNITMEKQNQNDD